MARKVTVTLTDDLDDTLEAEETIEFSIDGVDYEIDLATKNADKLRKALTPYKDAARRVGGRKKPSRAAGTGRPSVDREQTRAIREWAKANGHAVSDRGRISQEVMDAYNNS
ncbi:histone-like nucleoid-structuring protein Lsr2 [Tsukamurella strandjordii]|uniref:Lsr2 family protein n=1 Tax=Tsukamurella strandjordii TaxID=147577 RepID=A0AA90SR90_9ACTN|nr:Lsr2 family protein [Tsukamurella strandjordii]MDP0398706.1 Lsr2 family protein [Tsukamurella strandjordii]